MPDTTKEGTTLVKKKQQTFNALKRTRKAFNIN